MQQSFGFEVVMNAGSGCRAALERQAIVERVLGEGGRAVRVHMVRRPRQLHSQIQAAVRRAQDSAAAVVAAGGDGTINAVVQQVLGSGLKFGALPQGTFNFFGRSHGLSEDIETAARDLLDAELREVQVGLVNERVFLINASLGLYRRLLQDREQYKQRLGRSRLVALWAGFNTLLRTQRRLRLRIQGAEGEHCEDVLTLLAANNRLQLEQLGVPDPGRVERGELLGIQLKPQSRWALLQLALRGLAGLWENTDQAAAFGFHELIVEPARGGRRRLQLALDGELLRMQPPLRFRVSPQRLPLLVPRTTLEPTAAAAADAIAEPAG